MVVLLIGMTAWLLLFFERETGAYFTTFGASIVSCLVEVGGGFAVTGATFRGAAATLATTVEVLGTIGETFATVVGTFATSG